MQFLCQRATCSAVPGHCLCSHQQKLSIFGYWQVLQAYPEPHELLLEIALPEAPVVTLKNNMGGIQLTATAEVMVMVIQPGDVLLPSEYRVYEGTTHAEIPSAASPRHRAVSLCTV